MDFTESSFDRLRAGSVYGTAASVAGHSCLARAIPRLRSSRCHTLVLRRVMHHEQDDAARPRGREEPAVMATYVPPVERPKGFMKKAMYLVMRRMFGLVPTGTKVFTARMPTAFMTYYARAYRLDKKLRVPIETAYIVRHQVASINMCAACMDIGR